MQRLESNTSNRKDIFTVYQTLLLIPQQFNFITNSNIKICDKKIAHAVTPLFMTESAKVFHFGKYVTGTVSPSPNQGAITHAIQKPLIEEDPMLRTFLR